MGHLLELLQRIQFLMEQEYPCPEFEYVFEQALPQKPCYRPDILIWRRNPKQLVCVVEIGYTRPEKLAFYQSSEFDYRWFDKEGKLHCGVPINSFEKPKHNCVIKVRSLHASWKPELYAPFELLGELKVIEFTRFITIWDNDFISAVLSPEDDGRMWGRRSAIKEGPLVGQARLRLKPRGEAISFKPGERDDIWVGKEGHQIVLRLDRPLVKATDKALKALKIRKASQ